MDFSVLWPGAGSRHTPCPGSSGVQESKGRGLRNSWVQIQGPGVQDSWGLGFQGPGLQGIRSRARVQKDSSVGVQEYRGPGV